MVFVRKKEIKGNLYYYLVETRKHRQQHLKYLGRQIPDDYLQYVGRGKTKGRPLL